MNNYETPQIKEFMTGFTVESYNYTASSMKIYIPALQIDKNSSSTVENISIPSGIFKSKENIYVSTTVSNLNYCEIKVSSVFTATFKTLGYDLMTGPHFPKNSKMRIYIPDLNIEEALIVPLI